MSTALAKTGPAQLARQEDGLTDEQITLIKNTIAKGSTNEELALFVQTAKRLRLDPFARQIFLVKRWDSQVNGFVATPQVSVDGFRLVAERTGQYRGQTAPQWCGMDGKWTDVWLDNKPPAAARVGVYREGFAEPLVRVALYRSYAQTKKDGTPNAMWAKYPEVMLAKCAESLALRSAFPNELSGVYTDSEMPEPVEAPARPARPVRGMDDIAAGGQRAVERPTSSGSTSRAEPTAQSSAAPSAASASDQATISSATAASSTATTDGELLDAAAWRARYESLCEDLMQSANWIFGQEDEHSLPVPPVPCPAFGPDGKRYANKSYDDPACVGFLRKRAQASDFAEVPADKRIWALYAVCRHELAKVAG
jgi:phage recombination protein Bet